MEEKIEVKFCPQCGSSVEPQMQFCPNCGAKLQIDFEDPDLPGDTAGESAAAPVQPPQGDGRPYVPPQPPQAPASQYPVYPPAQPQQEKKPMNVFGLVGMIVGIVSLFIGYIFGFILGITAITFSAIGMAKGAKYSKRGFAITGLICGIIATIYCLSFMIAYGSLIMTQ